MILIPVQALNLPLFLIKNSGSIIDYFLSNIHICNMKKFDFLIVGAGIFGITTAIELRKRDYEVCIINPDKIPHPLAASTDINKIVRMEYGSDLFYLEMANECIDIWHNWNKLFGETLYHEVGFMLACRASMESEKQNFEKVSYNHLISKGHQPERMQGETISTRFPAFKKGVYIDGFYHKKAGYAESGRVVEKLTEYGRQLGVSVFEGQTAIELVRSNNQVLGIKTKEGAEFKAGHTIICAGAYTPYLIPELQPFMNVTGHAVFHVKPSRPELFSYPNLSVFSADTSNTGWYGFPMHPHEKVIKIANHGVGLKLHPEKDERVVTQKDVESFRHFLENTFPSLANDPIVYTRRCLYCDTLDGDFWIDQHPNLSGLTIGAGGSGHGFKMAPVLGSLIANAAENIEDPRLNRFRWRALSPDTILREEVRFME